MFILSAGSTPPSQLSVLISYSSPFAKESNPARFSTPEAMASCLSRNPDAEFALDVQDFRLVDERWTDFSQKCIIKTSVSTALLFGWKRVFFWWS